MQLQTVGIQGLRQLQALYRREWPKYCQEFAILKNLIAFDKVEPGMKHVRAYSLQDPQAQRLGLFLIVDRYQLFVGCQGESLDLLAQALHLLDWSSGMLCTSVPDRYIETVLQVMQEKQLVIEFHHLSDIYHIPAKQALQFHVDCPKGFQLKSLSEQDAHLLDQEWAYSHEGSLFFIQRQIRLCPSMGLYDEDTQQLVAWCIRTQDGLLATLHVQNAYKRRGFGSLIVRALARRIADLGDDVTAEIYAENIPSVNMFNKLGFRVIDQCHWLNIAPAAGSFTWPEGE
ncbi:uncharacterized protein [Drosophila virilis]|uniref:N-acetyltransferase domain-containing protein n=1 Tax=Drosophila virilis TaxID=7244 RepID=B4LT96_DROVI|nr:uncharacterized protein LOC6627500 [Drosophila virilis]EDW64938.1 uncharacterized protein Dvir_GJ17751 [Drosophila virilis]